MTTFQSSYASARSVNSEAGEHPIGGEPAERAAAEAATRLSWREFPYYPRRYGERGYRFSLSDGGWLETLCHQSAAAATAQVVWLANMLAARGMPSYLMERHLAHLGAELTSKPGTPDRHAMLATCEAALRDRRQRTIEEATFLAIAATFEASVTHAVGRIANVGVILVAAVADERNGVASAVESVEAFVLDEKRFDRHWRGGAHRDHERARGPPVRSLRRDATPGPGVRIGVISTEGRHMRIRLFLALASVTTVSAGFALQACGGDSESPASTADSGVVETGAVDAARADVDAVDAADAAPQCDTSKDYLGQIPDASIADGASTTSACVGCTKARCSAEVAACANDCPCQDVAKDLLECYATTQNVLGCFGSVGNVPSGTQAIGTKLFTCVASKCQSECATGSFLDGGDGG